MGTLDVEAGKARLKDSFLAEEGRDRGGVQRSTVSLELG